MIAVEINPIKPIAKMRKAVDSSTLGVHMASQCLQSFGENTRSKPVEKNSFDAARIFVPPQKGHSLPCFTRFETWEPSP